MTESSSSTTNWTTKDVIWAFTLLAGLIFNFAALTNKVDNVSSRVSSLESKYEREVVPRTEHLEMNRRLDDRLQIIEGQLKELLNRRVR